MANVKPLPTNQTPAWFAAHLLINEPAFKGENNFVSWADTSAAMKAVASEVYNRLSNLPSKYTQSEVADVTTNDLREIIAANTTTQQYAGFSKSGASYVVEANVLARVANLISIGNQGAAGAFAAALNEAIQLATDLTAGNPPADPFDALPSTNGITITGGIYGHNTGTVPIGGNFVPIASADGGFLAGNRCYSLRKTKTRARNLRPKNAARKRTLNKTKSSRTKRRSH